MSSLSYNKEMNSVIWTCIDTINAIEYLLDNVVVCNGDSLYRQVIGMRMGTNCAQFIADLLYVNE